MPNKKGPPIKGGHLNIFSAKGGENDEGDRVVEVKLHNRRGEIVGTLRGGGRLFKVVLCRHTEEKTLVCRLDEPTF